MEAVFPSNSNLFLNESSIPTSGNQEYYPAFCLVETILFHLDIFVLVCGKREIQFLKNNLIPARSNWFYGQWKPFVSSILIHLYHC